MPTIALRFPGGLYHATPSGHHVNEGLVEWPPSPWRLVRSLLACGYATQHWTEVPAAARRLIEALCSVLPEYRLPPAALGHSRHYMPMASFDKGRERTTLVIDTFADVGSEPLYVHWPVSLDTEAHATLKTLVEHLGYLGRSESWVLGDLVSDDLLPDTGKSQPHQPGHRPGISHEQISVLAPECPEQYAQWRSAELSAAARPSEGAKKLSAAQLKKVESNYPSDLLDALQWDTARWQQARWSQAPGTRRVIYWRPSSALEVSPATCKQRQNDESAKAVLLALATSSGSQSALPVIARTIPQAELLHQAVVSRLKGRDCPELSGRDSITRAPLKGHRHAHILPLDLDQDGRLDHIVVYAAMGLSEFALSIVRGVPRTYTKRGNGELQVSFAGQGTLDQLCALPDKLGDRARQFFGTSSKWISATPFVPPRFLRKRGRHTLEGQVAEELATRGFPEARVTVTPWTNSGTQPKLNALRHIVSRRRDGAPQPPAHVSFVLTLEFTEDVSGPICLGYGSHFGLGLFSNAGGRP